MNDDGRIVNETMVRFERVLPGPVERVWEFLTRGEHIAEWFGATEGLGYLVFFAGQTLNVPTLFVGVAAFAVLGIVGFELVRRFEAYITPWKKEAQGQ